MHQRSLFPHLVAAALALHLLTTPATAEEAPVIVALGDSLTAGFGLGTDDAFPARLERALGRAGVSVVVVDAGVSGDTTAGGRTRLDWVLADAPDLVIVELGANDGLRGLDPASTFDNLDDILTRLGERGVEALLAGMLAPPNLGREYGDAFNGNYRRLAEKHGVVFYPFFLDGVAGRLELNQADGIHPNAAGVDIIVEGILPYVIEALKRVEGSPGAPGVRG
ncbi:MAG: arylesterase [Alphaproteobacteria bacterium]